MNRASLLICLLALSACGDSVDLVGPDAAGPPLYSLSVSVSTTGHTPGGDFTVTVDGRGAMIGVNGTLSLGYLPAGRHQVALTVRPDCTVTEALRDVDLSQNATIEFQVVCVGFGTVRFFTESLGASPWGNHSIEWEPGDIGSSLVANGTTEVRLVSGRYSPWFIPARNCSGQGSLGMIDLNADESIEFRLQATCAPFGPLRISLSATGEELPTAIVWQAVHLGTGAVERVALMTGTTTDLLLPQGDWVGQLVQLPPNCQVTSADPATFSIAEYQVAEMTVSVSCTPYKGWIRVSLAATGPDAYFGLAINGDSCTPDDTFGDFCQPLSRDRVTLLELPPGSYAVHVTPFYYPDGGATTCTVSPTDPIVAVVQTGVVTDVTFKVACV